MRATATRTYNPLPFHDLEPRRFEDLVRQLAYDFRPWQTLEATGRSGGDDGFDIRGFETDPASTETSQDEDAEPAMTGRLWLIQCKREREIGPTKMASHLRRLKRGSEESLYGVIFATAANISKRTRDIFRTWCRENRVSEGHVWAAGELEDMLFQPKNDGLLFAYFGISLTIKRRSTTSLIRGEIATKKKLARIINASWAPVLLRDPNANSYPDNDVADAPLWKVYRHNGITHQGLRLEIKWHHAIVDPLTGEWDTADATQATHVMMDDPWTHPLSAEKQRQSEEASEIWTNEPDLRKAWIRVYGAVRMGDILAIDEDGDDCFHGPHIYVPFHPTSGPFRGSLWWEIDAVNGPLSAHFAWDRRTSLFPSHLRLSQTTKASN